MPQNESRTVRFPDNNRCRSAFQSKWFCGLLDGAARLYISTVYEAAPGAASFRGTTALICTARIGNSLDRSGLYAEKGGQHGLEWAGLGCVDILRTPVRRGNDGARE